LNEQPGWLAVIADDQTKGRGTSGRSWVSTRGNLFLTCAIPMEVIPLTKVTLLPLGVGLLIAETIQPYVGCRPILKWPNDVLLDHKKIAGTLIENHRVGTQDFWLVGIGLNIQSSPTALPTENKDFRPIPRRATCLQEYVLPNTTLPSAVELGTTLATKLRVWSSNLHQLDAVKFIEIWKAWSDIGATYEIRETGESVRIIDIEADGQLRVETTGGKERLLVADYFF
jgi:BirA family biotin operon repressor/biotin-[acetyl-CoA-carboxylase] ligase